MWAHTMVDMIYGSAPVNEKRNKKWEFSFFHTKKKIQKNEEKKAIYSKDSQLLPRAHLNVMGGILHSNWNLKPD